MEEEIKKEVTNKILCTFCTNEKIKTITLGGRKIYLCLSCLIAFK